MLLVLTKRLLQETHFPLTSPFENFPPSDLQATNKHPSPPPSPPQPNRLAGQVVKASASRAGDPGFESRLRRDFSGVESYQWLKNWHSSGYPARRQAL